MEKIYNKLVRDNIPSIIEKDNEIPFVRTLTEEEYQKELLKKLLEECNEVIVSSSEEEIVKELSDVLEVIRSIALLNNSNLEEIVKMADAKREKRGGFTKRIFLEKTISKK